MSGLSWPWWTVSAGPGKTGPGEGKSTARQTLSDAKPSPEVKVERSDEAENQEET